MIYITGDTHGDVDFDKLLKLKEKNLSYEDYLIICGDAAICWSPFDLIRFLRIYNNIGCTILFIDGTHLICIEFLSHSTSTNGERYLSGKWLNYQTAS